MDKNELLYKLIKDLDNMNREELIKQLDDYGIEYTDDRSNVYIKENNEIKTEEKEATIIKVNGNEIKLVWE